MAANHAGDFYVGPLLATFTGCSYVFPKSLKGRAETMEDWSANTGAMAYEAFAKYSEPRVDDYQNLEFSQFCRGIHT